MSPPRALLATTLTGAALLAGATAATAAQVPEIANTSAEQGWPHAPTTRELSRLAASVSLDLGNWMGTSPSVTRCRSFRECRAGWSAGARATARLRVYEDGSYRVLAVLFPVTTYTP